MTKSFRLVPIAAIAACLSLTPLACLDEDEPATYRPKSGNWVYSEQDVVSDTCPGEYVLDTLTTFTLDYDAGDSFEIELGVTDVTCEIDGTTFTCSEFEILGEDDPDDDFEVQLRWGITWEGTFLSETQADGNEIMRVTCIGEDCNLIKALPCTHNVTFEADAI